MAKPTNTNDDAPTVFGSIATFVFSMLRLNVLLLLTMSPLIVLTFGTRAPFYALPTFLGALWLCSPGIAAAFCTFRDLPGLEVLQRGERETYPRAVKAGVISDSHWDDGEFLAIVKPYFRAWRRYAMRALFISGIILGITLICVVDVSLAAKMPYGNYLAPFFVGLALLSFVCWPIGLVAITELPKARWWAILRTSLVQAVRCWYLSILTLIFLVALGASLAVQPILAAVFALGPILYVIWANSRWPLVPTFQALETEEKTGKAAGK